MVKNKPKIQLNGKLQQIRLRHIVVLMLDILPKPLKHKKIDIFFITNKNEILKKRNTFKSIIRKSFTKFVTNNEPH